MFFFSSIVASAPRAAAFHAAWAADVRQGWHCAATKPARPPTAATEIIPALVGPASPSILLSQRTNPGQGRAGGPALPLPPVVGWSTSSRSARAQPAPPLSAARPAAWAGVQKKDEERFGQGSLDTEQAHFKLSRAEHVTGKQVCDAKLRLGWRPRVEQRRAPGGPVDSRRRQQQQQRQQPSMVVAGRRCLA